MIYLSFSRYYKDSKISKTPLRFPKSLTCSGKIEAYPRNKRDAQQDAGDITISVGCNFVIGEHIYFPKRQ